MRTPTLLLLPLLAAFAQRCACQDDTAGPATQTDAEPANPIDTNDDSTLLSERSPPAVAYHCDGIAWKGKCTFTNLVNDKCEWFPWATGMSFGPPSGWQCRFFSENSCTGQFIPSQYLTVPLSAPGTPNWGALYGGGAKPLSWKCRQCPNALSCGTTYNAWSSNNNKDNGAVKPTITPKATKGPTKTMPWDWQKSSSVPLGIDPKNYATRKVPKGGNM